MMSSPSPPPLTVPLIEENRTFLEELANSPAPRRRQLLIAANDIQLSAISQVLKTYTEVLRANSEDKCLQKYKKVVARILKPSRQSLACLRKKLLKYNKYLPSVILYCLGKILQSVLCYANCAS
jgi:hypothetical protein